MNILYMPMCLCPYTTIIHTVLLYIHTILICLYIVYVLSCTNIHMPTLCLLSVSFWLIYV